MPMSTQLKIQMLKRGVTQRSIAKSLGVTPEAVYQEFAGHRHTERIRKAISEAVGWSERRIWPSAHGRKPPAEKTTPYKYLTL
jgi:lambda repressor-like predicted transcriptional regulator